MIHQGALHADKICKIQWGCTTFYHSGYPAGHTFYDACQQSNFGMFTRGCELAPLISEFLQPQVHDISALAILQQLPLGKRIPDSYNFP